MSERKCHCELCRSESALRLSLSSKVRRNDFCLLATDRPSLSSVDSPMSLIELLHRRESEASHQETTDEILACLIRAYNTPSASEVVSEILGVAFIPALHRIYRETCAHWQELAPEDVIQEVWVFFFQVLRLSSIAARHQYFSIAITRTVQRLITRWAAKETRSQCNAARESVDLETTLTSEVSDPERGLMLEDLLSRCRADGVLRANEYELLIKLKIEGYEAKELAATDSISPMALHHRLQRIMRRLRSITLA
jgi:DNA-directed RNA polymerase specialized sigma24 family protein